MKLLVYRPCSWGLMQPRTCTWLTTLYGELQQRYPEGLISTFETRSNRIAMTRNQACQKAIDGGFDYLLMVDPDMDPDAYVGELPEQKKFFYSAMDVLKEHPGSIVGAPACGPAPRYNCNVRVFTERGGGKRRMTRRELSQRLEEPAIEQVPAMGSGLLLIDVEALRRLPKPWFKDIYSEDWQTLRMGQDIYFTLMATKEGVKVWCNWYTFSGHWHTGAIDPPCKEPWDPNSEWDNDTVAMSPEAIARLDELVSTNNFQRVLEVGPGRSSYVIADGLDLEAEHHIFADDNEYTRMWMEQAEDRGYSFPNIQLADHASFVWEQCEPEGKYDLIVIDGPWGSQNRVNEKMLAALRKHSHQGTVFVIDDAHRVHEWTLVDVLAESRDSVSVRSESRETVFLTPEAVTMEG